MSAKKIIEEIKALPEGERALVAKFMIEENLKGSRRAAFLASTTTAFLLLSVFGIAWLLKKGPEAPVTTSAPPVVTAPAPVQMESPRFAERVSVTIKSAPALNQLARDPSTSSNLIDLTEYYNGDLMKNWENVEARERDNDLRELPSGQQTMAGTLFDVRGVIAVHQESTNRRAGDMNLPISVEGIRVGQKCKKIHFLHSAYNAAYSNLEEIGHYRVHLANGQEHTIRIVTGRDVLDWHKPVPPDSTLVVAWEGDNQRTRQRGHKIHLYKSTWENPAPDVEVQTIDLVGRQLSPAPFLVAITVE